MKKIIAVLALFAVVLTSGALFADGESETKQIFISVYNDIQKEYAVENTLAEAGEETILQSVGILKQKKLIKSYELSEDGRIKSIRFQNNSSLAVLETPTATEFKIRLNGEDLSESETENQLSDGDIVEIIYCIASEKSEPDGGENSGGDKTSQNVGTQFESNKLWTNDLSQYVKKACEWLDLNQEESSSYLVAYGCAGRAADVRKVSEIISGIKQKGEYTSPLELSKDVMNLSFCGYDLSRGEFSPLISKLLSFDDVNSFGIFGAINSLTAYDVKDYKIADGVINSRQKLINIILSYQKGDGSFSIFTDSQSDIDTTAIAITALSNYTDQPRVKEATEKAKDYIVSVQTNGGGFGFNGEENCESLAQVIIAMNSIGVPLDSKEFTVDGTNLIDRLLEYRGKDGGFSHLKGYKSSAMATEQAIMALSSVKRGGNPFKATESIYEIDGEKSEYSPEEIKNFNYTLCFIIIGAIVGVIIILFVILAILKKKDKKTKINEAKDKKGEEKQ